MHMLSGRAQEISLHACLVSVWHVLVATMLSKSISAISMSIPAISMSERFVAVAVLVSTMAVFVKATRLVNRAVNLHHVASFLSAVMMAMAKRQAEN